MSGGLARTLSGACHLACVHSRAASECGFRASKRGSACTPTHRASSPAPPYHLVEVRACAFRVVSCSLGMYDVRAAAAAAHAAERRGLAAFGRAWRARVGERGSSPLVASATVSSLQRVRVISGDASAHRSASARVPLLSESAPPAAAAGAARVAPAPVVAAPRARRSPAPRFPVATACHHCA